MALAEVCPHFLHRHWIYLPQRALQQLMRAMLEPSGTCRVLVASGYAAEGPKLSCPAVGSLKLCYGWTQV